MDPHVVSSFRVSSGSSLLSFLAFSSLQVTGEVTRNLNKIIDRNFYPVPETRRSNMRHRPIGIGVQGLADTFILMRMPFDSPEARKLNRQIFEALYFGSVKASNELAKSDGLSRPLLFCVLYVHF